MEKKLGIERIELGEDTTIIICQLHPEDVPKEQKFTYNILTQSKHWQFMQNFSQLKPNLVLNLININFDREAIVLAICKQRKNEVIVGIARYIINPNKEDCEFALIVSDEFQNMGIGSRLMTSLLTLAKNKGLKTMIGLVLSSNAGMLEFIKRFEFIILDSEEPTVKIITKLI